MVQCPRDGEGVQVVNDGPWAIVSGCYGDLSGRGSWAPVMLTSYTWLKMESKARDQGAAVIVGICWLRSLASWWSAQATFGVRGFEELSGQEGTEQCGVVS